MRLISVLTILFTLIFYNKQTRESQMIYTENEILKQLDLAYKQEPSEYYPKVRSQDIKYNFFLDLEHGYFETAGSRIHLYADENRWAIVFEKSGYQNRATRAEIELDYIGNCIDYPVDEFPDRNYISNASNIILIDSNEYERIENKNGSSDAENFELIANNVKEIRVRGKLVPFNKNYKDYEKVGINIKDYNNPKKLIGFGDLIRFYHETNPILVSASEDEIKKHIPKDLKKLMVIDEFHYNPNLLPSKQEIYVLISKILVTKDTSYWKPTLKSNNSWKNWESGNL
ncbi:DUF7003 family protein [Chryseobacterium lineare]